MTGDRSAGRAADRILTACASRPRLATAGAVAYLLLVTVTHDHVQTVAYALQTAFGRDVWAPAVAIGAALVLAAGCRAAMRRHRACEAGRAAAFAWWGTAALLVESFFTLLATNMEAIHFVQYAALAWPVWAVVRNFSATITLVTAAGAFDEWWQWHVLHRTWDVRWDTNDVVLNALGASFGCAAILTFATFRRRARPAPAAAWPIASVAMFGMLPAALSAAGLLVVYPEDGPAPIVLSRAPRPEDRWSEPSWGRGHYELHPGVAAALCLALAVAWAWADRHVVRDGEESP